MFRVSFDKYQYNNFIFATHKEDSQAELQANELTIKLAADFYMMLMRNITSNRHMGGYAPYNERYKIWKSKHGKSGSGYWKLFGDLLRSISTQRVRKTKRTSAIFVGIPRGARDSGGKSWYGKGDKGKPKSIEQYGSWMEYGRKGQPARPIFGPSLLGYIESGLPVRRATDSLNKLKASWS